MMSNGLNSLQIPSSNSLSNSGNNSRKSSPMNTQNNNNKNNNNNKIDKKSTGNVESLETKLVKQLNKLNNLRKMTININMPSKTESSAYMTIKEEISVSSQQIEIEEMQVVVNSIKNHFLFKDITEELM